MWLTAANHLLEPAAAVLTMDPVSTASAAGTLQGQNEPTTDRCNYETEPTLEISFLFLLFVPF